MYKHHIPAGATDIEIYTCFLSFALFGFESMGFYEHLTPNA
jgi:hypothetical protein